MADTMTADTLDLAPVLAVLDDHPVTNAEYAAFLDANPDANPDWEPFWPEPDAPAVRVSYHDALAYCAWAGVRLPTDDEWQTWGDSLPPDDPRRLVDGRSVWEWTATPRGDDYPGARRVVRGGSWNNGSYYARAAYRLWYYPGFRNDLVGFRVVRAAPDGARGSGGDENSAAWLRPHDHIVTAWAESAAGPGWRNQPVWVLVRAADGAHRVEAVQPDEWARSTEISALYYPSQAVHVAVTSAVRRFVGGAS